MLAVQRKFINRRWIDDVLRREEVEEKTGDEIAMEVIKRAGLRGRGERE